MLALYTFLAVIVFLVLMVIAKFNSLIQLKVSVDNAWSQIDVQLKRRYDLIPNLVETVKGYMAHERQTLENVTRARQQAIDAKNLSDKAAAENFLTGALRSLFAVAERYPDLKANQNALKLMEELTTTENKISFARQYYNDEVGRFNTAIQVFPGNVIASIFNFSKKVFFQLEDTSHKQAPQVKF